MVGRGLVRPAGELLFESVALCALTISLSPAVLSRRALINIMGLGLPNLRHIEQLCFDKLSVEVSLYAADLLKVMGFDL